MNPPHSHLPIGCPTTKITLTKFVITVAAQKLICPQGNTYPTKAVRKVKRNTTTPVSQYWTLPRYKFTAVFNLGDRQCGSLQCSSILIMKEVTQLEILE